jgi:hypothetical protein
MLIRVSDDMVFNFDYVTKISTEDNWIRFYSQNCIGYFCQIDNMTIDEFLKLYLEAKKKNELFLDLTMPESKPISLEVGKTYITRGGNDVTITRSFSIPTTLLKACLDGTIRYYTPGGEIPPGMKQTLT